MGTLTNEKLMFETLKRLRLLGKGKKVMSGWLKVRTANNSLSKCCKGKPTDPNYSNSRANSSA